MNPLILFTTMSLIETCWMLHPSTLIKSCGVQLSSALQEVCQSGLTSKRSGHIPAISDLDESDYDYSYDSDPNYNDLVARYAYRAKKDMFSQYKKGLVDGCCRRTCTLLELVGYCQTEVPIPRFIKALNLY